MVVFDENRYITMGARIYDPDLGQFLSVDPLADIFAFTSPYVYANNSPINISDPSGLAPEKDYGDKFMESLSMSGSELNVNNFAESYGDQMNADTQRSAILWAEDFNIEFECFKETGPNWGSGGAGGGSGDKDETKSKRTGDESSEQSNGKISLTNNKQIKSNLNDDQMESLERKINLSEETQKQWRKILNELEEYPNLTLVINAIDGPSSGVEGFSDRIEFNISKDFLDINEAEGFNDLAAVSFIAHESAHILGRLTGERICFSEVFELNGQKINVEEIRAQQIANEILIKYVVMSDQSERIFFTKNNYQKFENKFMHYKSGTDVYNLSGYFLPGTFDFSNYKTTKPNLKWK